MIPKIIHLCWLSGDQYPDLIRRCIDTWKKYLPDYQIMIWDTNRIDLSKHQWVREAFEKKKYAFAADYIRLYALYHHGGIYLDADVEVLKNLDTFLSQTSFVGHESGGDLEPAIIGSEPHVEWIGECLKYYDGKSFVKDDGSLDMRPLPLIVGDVIIRIYGSPQVLGVDEIYRGSDISIYPAAYFSPKSHHTGYSVASDVTYTIHHFDGQWVEKNLAYHGKRLTHLLLSKIFGVNNHRRFINLIRRIKS
jgi:hypothetical protein